MTSSIEPGSDLAIDIDVDDPLLHAGPVAAVATAAAASEGTPPAVQAAITFPLGSTYPPVYQSAMAVGCLGAMYGRREDSEIVGQSMDLAVLYNGPFRLVRAICEGVGGNAAFAQEHLAAYVRDNPQDDAAKVITAVSLMLAGDPGWLAHIENVLASSSDPSAREAALGLVNFLLAQKR